MPINMASINSPQKPLRDKKVFVACSPKKSDDLVTGLESMGGNVLPLQVIAVQEIADKRPIHRALASLAEYTWIIFTSSYGVTFFFQHFNKYWCGRKHEMMPKICAVGPATAKTIKKYGFAAELIPQQYVAEGILQALKKYHGGLHNLAGHRIMIPRAKEARDILPRMLTSAGARVDVIFCYQTTVAKLDADFVRQIRDEVPDLLVFTSSSTIRNLITILGHKDGMKMLRGATVATLGPITARTAEAFGKHAEIIPRENTLPSLIKAIRDYYSR